MTSVPGPAVQAIAYHDTLAASWSQRYASGGFKRRADFFTAEVLPKARIVGDWIDVGCGSGHFSRMLARAGAEVTGIDGSAAMIAAARGFRDAGPAPRYEVGTVEALSRETGGYDGALLLSVMEYLDDPSSSLGAITRLLRPGGTLIFSAPNRHSGLRRVQRKLRDLGSGFGAKAFAYLASSRNAWSRQELVTLAASHGLACEALLGFDPVAPRWLWPIVRPSLWFAVCRKRA